MHVGHSYKITEFILWTRRPIYLLTAISVIFVVLYQVLELRWLAIPWGVVFMLGTTVALMAGFKNTQTYNRTSDAQQVWASITAMSRLWGVMSRDYAGGGEDSRRLVYRHLAWLTALRYQMRDTKAWETTHKASNAEYKKNYGVPEKENAFDAELTKYVSISEKSRIQMSPARASEALGLQSDQLKAMLEKERITPSFFVELQKILREFHDLQAKAERIKNYPYPRQYAIVNTIFVRILCVLLPLGMINELEPLNNYVSGPMEGNMVWLAIPLSALICWMYVALDQVGESSSNPFEGGANDIPISQICSSIEVDLRQVLGESDIPAVTGPANPIVL